MAYGEQVRIFVSGQQQPQFIIETLNSLEESFEVTEVCGLASSPCMETIMSWCDDMGVPVILSFPETLTKKGIINASLSMVQTEYPDLVLIYKEEEELSEFLEMASKDSPSVQYFIKQDSWTG